MKIALLSLAAMLSASAASADVQLAMQNGRVSIVAKDATVRQILAEWARVGQTTIVNAERVPGGPLTLELTNVPESQALEILLRSLSGYITAPRPAGAADLSSFDRIIIMPTVAAARQPASAAPPPVFQSGPQFSQQPIAADDQDQEPPPQTPVFPPPGAGRGPVFNTSPQPQMANPQTGGAPGVYPPGFPPPQQQPAVGGQPFGGQPPFGGFGGQQPFGAQPPFNGAQPQQQPPPPQPSAVPTAPFGGVAVPGMVAPAPQQPGQPGQLQQPNPQPGQPVRRPGGA